MKPNIKPIETLYNGYRFRSRLEARWAVFFDALGVKYEYEKEGYDLGELGWYLPDFWLPEYGYFNGEGAIETTGAWVEIKGTEPTIDELNKCRDLADFTGTPVFLLRDIPADTNVHRTWISIPHWNVVSHSYPAKLEDYYLNVSPIGYSPYHGVTFDCPVCGSEYVHASGPTKDPIEGSDAVCVAMYCENGCDWVLAMRNNKGNISLSVESPHRSTTYLPFILADFDTSKLKAAYTAARSARFEHGEKPVLPQAVSR